MAYDEGLADRIRISLDTRSVEYLEKKMFGGLAFMVDNKMCVGVTKNNLMARIDPEFYEEALTILGSKIMDFTGRPMKGFLFIEPRGIDLDKDLDFWIDKCLEYNPKAKSKKKK